MKSEPVNLKLEIYSRLDLSDPRSLRIRDLRLSAKETEALTMSAEFRSDASERLLRFIAEYDSGFYCPEMCDVYEPIRENFNAEQLSDPIRWLSQPFGRVMLKRTRPYRYEGFVENKRLGNSWVGGSPTPMSTVGDPLFLTEWCLWLRIKILKLKTLAEVVQFFKDLYLISHGDYGFIALEEDHDLKNYLHYKPYGGRFIGDKLEECLPGVYWGNIFGKLYVDWLGMEKFDHLPCSAKHRLKDGSYYVQSSDELEYFKKPDAVNYVDEIIDYLGRDAFFDINDPLRPCVVPPIVGKHGRGGDSRSD